jgi:hypothetical protein
MSELAISAMILAIMIASAWIGARLRSHLPEHHLSNESKEAIKIGIGGITTLAALVLGLLVASAKESFDTKRSEVQQVAAKILLLDGALRQLGRDGDKPRELIRQSLAANIGYTWVTWETSQAGGPGSASAPTAAPGIEQLERLVSAIAPVDDAQRGLQSRALQSISELAQLRWLFIEQSESSISVPLLVVLVLWLAIVVAGVSILAPSNGTVRTIGLLCLVAVASTIFIILEMDQPFQGLIRIPDAPLRNLIANLDR